MSMDCLLNSELLFLFLSFPSHSQSIFWSQMEPLFVFLILVQISYQCLFLLHYSPFPPLSLLLFLHLGPSHALSPPSSLVRGFHCYTEHICEL